MFDLHWSDHATDRSSCGLATPYLRQSGSLPCFSGRSAQASQMPDRCAVILRILVSGSKRGGPIGPASAVDQCGSSGGW